MAKLQTALRILRVLAQNPQRLGKLIDAEAEYREYVVSKYRLTFGLPTIDLLDLFPDFEETVEPCSFLEGGALPINFALLKRLARRYESAHYLEIGTWRGESVANVASVAYKCTTLDLSPEDLKQRGLLKVSNVQGYFSKNLPNVRHISHDSQTFDFSSLGEKYDLILVDGDSQYRTIKNDTSNAFALLRDERSVIVWHAYGPSAESARWSSLAGILDGCPPERRANLYHVSNTKAAIYIQGNFKTRSTSFPELPDKSIQVHLSIKLNGSRARPLP